MEELITRYKRDLILRGFSPRTCQHYFANVKQFLSYYQQPIEQLSDEEIKDYLFYLISDLKSSDSKIRQAHGAIKYLYTKTLSRPWDIASIPQLKKKKKLPSVLTVDEVFSLLKSGTNLKHQALLTLIYSSGLRVSESVNIQISDIKRDKNCF